MAKLVGCKEVLIFFILVISSDASCNIALPRKATVIFFVESHTSKRAKRRLSLVLMLASLVGSVAYAWLSW